VKYWL